MKIPYFINLKAKLKITTSFRFFYIFFKRFEVKFECG